MSEPLTQPTAPSSSPCVSVCKMNNQTGLCEGCWRTIDEIAAWGTASEALKQNIWERIRQRQFLNNG